MQKSNLVITTKNDKGKLLLFFDKEDQVTIINGVKIKHHCMLLVFLVEGVMGEDKDEEMGYLKATVGNKSRSKLQQVCNRDGWLDILFISQYWINLYKK